MSWKRTYEDLKKKNIQIKINKYRSEKIPIKHVSMIWICGAYQNCSKKKKYLTWNKEDDLIK